MTTWRGKILTKSEISHIGAKGRLETGKPAKPRIPCDGCKRVHLGPRCKPAEKRSISVAFTLPGHVARRFREVVPWGERSAYVSALLERELG